jgi:hypothetical protein
VPSRPAGRRRRSVLLRGVLPMPHDVAMRSLELFITEVMPHFASQPAEASR